MAQTLHSPQRYRGFVLTAAGLDKLHERIKQLEAQTRLRQSPRTIAERVQLSQPDGIHPITVRKILAGENGVDKRSIQLVFQVLQLQLEEGDCAHAGLCQQPAETCTESRETVAFPDHQNWSAMLNGAHLCGRTRELTQLHQAIIAEQCRLVQILGMAGVGKTALSTLLAKSVEHQFEVVIWKSLHHAPTAQTVLTKILQLLMQHVGGGVALPDQVEALSRLLMEQLQNRRCLIVLDRFDSVLCDQQSAGYSRPKYEAYGELLQMVAEVPHQSCLVVTSREKPRVIGAAEYYSRSLQLNGLSVSDCQQICKGCSELVGTMNEWRSLVLQYDANPLVLKIVAAHVQNYFSGRIADYLEHLQRGQLLFGDLRDLLAQQFNRLSPLEQELVYCLGLYQEPILISQFREDVASFMNQQYCLEGLDSLDRRSLLCRQAARLSLNPLMKQYVNECLLEQQDHSLFKSKLKVVAN